MRRATDKGRGPGKERIDKVRDGGSRMDRNKKGVMPQITRETYKRVKKYDRQQFMAFCTDLYGFGYEDGKESAQGVDLEAVCKAIEGMKGIGPKRSREIRAQLEQLFEGGQDGQAGTDRGRGYGHSHQDTERSERDAAP